MRNLIHGNSNLAPGAEDLLQRIEAMEGLDEKQRVNVGHQIRHLTVDEWATVCRAFDEWPFAPEVSGQRLGVECFC